MAKYGGEYPIRTKIDYGAGDIRAALSAQDKEFEELNQKSLALPKGEVVGAVIKFQVADGYACYIVTKDKPLTLQHLDFCEYQIPEAHMRGLAKKDVLEQLGRERMFAKLR